MRILVTGSRDWTDFVAVQEALCNAVAVWRHLHPELGNGPTDWVTVVHGACPSGADLFAHEFCTRVTGWSVEAYPADWSLGRTAGPLRNQEMVDRGADVCLAFIDCCTSPRCSIGVAHPSHGASGCADAAQGAGIPTHRYYGAHLTDPGPG